MERENHPVSRSGCHPLLRKEGSFRITDFADQFHMSIRYEKQEEEPTVDEGENGEGGESVEAAVAVPRVTPYYTYALLAA